LGCWNSFQRCDVPPEGCKRVHRLDHINVLYMFFSGVASLLSIKLAQIRTARKLFHLRYTLWPSSRKVPHASGLPS
jgi:hypothetical protein